MRTCRRREIDLLSCLVFVTPGVKGHGIPLQTNEHAVCTVPDSGPCSLKVCNTNSNKSAKQTEKTVMPGILHFLKSEFPLPPVW